MKKTLLIVTLLLGYSGIAQVTFQTQTTGTTQDLKGTTIIPGTTRGWAAGTGGTILYTADGGITWTAQSSGVTATLEDITWGASGAGGLEFVWACGSSATVVNTMDAGTTWDIQAQGAPYTANAIDFQNVSNGIMVGDQFYATSTNGGNAFSPTMTTSTARAVHFVSTTTGWMCGDGGFIKKTTDSGVTWTDQTSGTTLALHGINFINANEGWACGITGTILHTTNGGTTWTAQTSNTANLLSDIKFFDAQNGWACGYTGTMLRTTNGGTTWTPYFSGETGTAVWLQSLALLDANEGWVVGDDGVILTFSDNGSSAGIENLSAIDLNIYPNPASSTLTIETEAAIESIQITNINGMLVQNETSKSFSIESLTNGVYIIHVKTAKGVITKRFIKD